MLTKELQETFTRSWQEAKNRRHEHLTLEHLLFALLEEKTGRDVITKCGGNPDKLKKELDQFMKENMEEVPLRMEPFTEHDLFSSIDPRELPPVGSVRRGSKGKDGERLEEEGALIEVNPEQTAAFERVVQRAVQQALSSGQNTIDGGNVLAAMFQEKRSHAVYLLEKQGVSRLDVLSYISHGITKSGGGPELYEADGQGHPTSEQLDDPLGQFTVDLIAKARENKIDPLIGRESEVRRTIEVLCRRRKNNPIYVGDPGVGKTAIAEGLALKIARGEVPNAIKNSEVYMLDMGALIAGTQFRG
ncbi:MAG TPA: Clp protease N-terminal domain-containing protein, partial [Chroococcales cyanobacterium]